MKYLRLALCALLPILFTHCGELESKGDLTFAKNTFGELVRGESSVISKIDWETLTALGMPVGQQFVAIDSEKEKEQFTNSFVTQFSTNFRESGGSIDGFTNWQVISHDDTHTKVTADSGNGGLKLTVSKRNGVERLSAFEIVK